MFYQTLLQWLQSNRYNNRECNNSYFSGKLLYPYELSLVTTTAREFSQYRKMSPKLEVL